MLPDPMTAGEGDRQNRSVEGTGQRKRPALKSISIPRMLPCGKTTRLSPPARIGGAWRGAEVAERPAPDRP